MAKEFTKEELQQYNGQNGQPSYVAVEGVVYDVSGKDLTKIITSVAPHGKRVLDGLPVVGKLVE